MLWLESASWEPRLRPPKTLISFFYMKGKNRKSLLLATTCSWGVIYILNNKGYFHPFQFSILFQESPSQTRQIFPALQEAGQWNTARGTPESPSLPCSPSFTTYIFSDPPLSPARKRTQKWRNPAKICLFSLAYMYVYLSLATHAWY